MTTTMKFFGAAAALAVVALVISALATDRLAGEVAYAAGSAAVILFVLGLVQMTSAKKP